MSLLDRFDVCLDLFERARRLIFVEVAVEVDLVTDLPDLAIFVVAHRFIDPRVGNSAHPRAAFRNRIAR